MAGRRRARTISDCVQRPRGGRGRGGIANHDPHPGRNDLRFRPHTVYGAKTRLHTLGECRDDGHAEADARADIHVCSRAHAHADSDSDSDACAGSHHSTDPNASSVR